MEEKLKFREIPAYNPTLTFDRINSDDIDEIINVLLSLTNYSNDSKLILDTLEKFLKQSKIETHLIVFQCLSRYIELFETIPLDIFLPYIIDGFYNGNDDVKYFARECLKNIMFYNHSEKVYTKNEIVEILKSGKTIDIIRIIIFVFENNFEIKYLSDFIKRCLNHNDAVIQFYGGLLLSETFNNIFLQFLELENSIKTISKLNSNDGNEFKKEIVTNHLEIMEDIIFKFKNKLK